MFNLREFMSFINVLRRVHGGLPLFLLEFFRTFPKCFLLAGRYGMCPSIFNLLSLTSWCRGGMTESHSSFFITFGQ